MPGLGAGIAVSDRSALPQLVATPAAYYEPIEDSQLTLAETGFGVPWALPDVKFVLRRSEPLQAAARLWPLDPAIQNFSRHLALRRGNPGQVA